MSEATRRQNNATRVLAYLEARGSATNAELIEVGGFRFGGDCRLTATAQQA